jgi:hypothetical protein
MFTLANKSAFLSSANPRAEIHGEERKPAMDLKFKIESSNDILDSFDSKLKAAFFERDAEPRDLLPEEQGAMRGLKFNQIKSIKWESDLPGYELHIHWGVSGVEDIKLSDIQVDNFEFSMKDGGTVFTSFRVQAHPEANVAGRLCELIQREIEISLVPPTAKQSDLVEKAQKPKKKTAAEKAGGDDDPFAGSDLARGAENGPKDDAESESEEGAQA